MNVMASRWLTATPRLPILKMPTGLRHRSGYCYPCLSPLPVLGVAFSSAVCNQASILWASVRCLRLEGLLKPNTTHYTTSLPPFDLPSLLDSPPLPVSCSALDMLHSCCHSALSQLQFIPSSWPFRDMHSPGRRGRAVAATHVFTGPFYRPMQMSFGFPAV